MNRMGYQGNQSGSMGMIPGGTLGKAKYAMATGRPDEAERICRKRLEREPGDVPTRVVLAQTLLQMQQVPEAIEEARRALRGQANNVDALMVLSSALLQRGGMAASLRGVPPEAEQAARRAVQLQPKTSNTHIQLAEVLVRKRDYAGARKEIDDAIKIEPRSPGAHLMRAIVLLSDKDPEGAIQASDAAIRNGRQLAPGSLAQADLIKANALLEVRRYDEALSALNSAERQNPTIAGANGRTMRGRIFFKQRKIAQSYAEFLGAQRATGRLKFLAPALAGLNMVVVGFFGQNAPFVLVFILILVALLIFFGISLIPVVGGWIVMALVVALTVYTAYTFLRQQGVSFWPLDAARLPAALVAFAALVAVTAGVLVIENLITTDLLHSRAGPITPTSLGIALCLGVVGAAGAYYGWPRLIGRYSGRATKAV